MNEHDQTLEDQMGHHWDIHNDHQEDPDEQEDAHDNVPEPELYLPNTAGALTKAMEANLAMADAYHERAEELAAKASCDLQLGAALFRHLCACHRLLANAQHTIAEVIGDQDTLPF